MMNLKKNSFLLLKDAPSLFHNCDGDNYRSAATFLAGRHNGDCYNLFGRPTDLTGINDYFITDPI
jgi:hypothetical protein